MVLPEVFISAIITGLVKSATGVLADHLKERLSKRVERLNTTLLTISTVLIDAEEKQITDRKVQSWLNEVVVAICEAEDAFDNIVTEDLCKKTPKLLKKVSSLSMSRYKMVKRVQKRLDELALWINFYNLKNIGTPTVTPIARPRTSSLPTEERVFGRQTEKEELKGFLMADNKGNSNISVVAIVGIGGVGKTTLAQLLYNDQHYENPFTGKAWIHVSDGVDVLSLTKTIYKSIISSDCSFTDLDQLQDCSFTDLDQLQVSLARSLSEKKILLVFDDMWRWSEIFKEWDLLCRPFKSAAKGSRIIVTTRSHHVVKKVCAVSYTHTLQPLSEEACRELLMKQILSAEERNLSREFAILAEQVVDKCKGLPLAAKAFGGLLASERRVDYWKMVLNSKIWTPPTNGTDILPVLRVSYHYLPSHLKRCFAYCSIFPKGYAFDKEMVVLLWMAEGLLEQPDNIETTEHVGDEYFSELVSRSLFQQQKRKFIMHDLINELAQFAAGEFCFKFEEQNQKVSGKTRHLSYLRDQYSGETMKFELLHGAKFLRTFLPLSHNKDSSQTCYLDRTVIHKLLPRLTCLRVLSLSHYDITMLPQDIFSKMRHVRYLDLSGTNLEKLPTSVCFLYHLQTLLLAYCSHLIELDKTICDLIRLKHLDLTATKKLKKMPENFGRLKELQTLTTFVVGAGEGAKISALRDLTDLRGKLTILQLFRVEDISDAGEANLESKTHLKEIDFTWRILPLAEDYFPGKPKGPAVFQKLRPHSQIEEITVRNYCGNSFPMWMSDPSFSSIVRIRLTRCQRSKSLPSLGRLPGLKELYISEMEQLESIGLEFYTSHPELPYQEQQPFRSLQILSLKDMPKWKEWVNVNVYGESLFPNLQELALVKCPKLASGLPGIFPSLTTLKIHRSQNLDFQLDANKYKKLQQQGVTIEL